MRGGPFLALVLAIVTMTAGCAGGTAKAGPSTSIAPAPSAVVSADTGSITGTITDEELRPLVGADVAVNGPAASSATTDGNGRFTMNELTPGSYVLTSLKLGFESAAKRVEVAAGEAVEVAIALEAMLVDEDARTESKITDGFMAGPDFYSPAVVVYYTYTFKINVTKGVNEVVNTMAWDSSAPMTARYLMNRVSHGSEVNSTAGPSPITTKLSELELKKDKDKIDVSYYVWFFCPLAPTCFVDHPDALLPVVAYQQRVKHYSTSFYNSLAPEGFTGLP